MEAPSEGKELVLSELQPPNKRRKKKSPVWDHFTIENVGNGIRRACCIVCKQTFAYSTGSKVAGTSHLKRHTTKCSSPLNHATLNQLAFYSSPSKIDDSTPGNTVGRPKRRYRTRTPNPSSVSFDPDRCRTEIIKMIMTHDYPLDMVEHPRFVSFVKNLQPRLDMVSFSTVEEECVSVYLREKQTVHKLIDSLPGRVSLSVDLWCSNWAVGYVVLTGHFIDSNWKLQRRILNVVMEPSPDSAVAFSHSVSVCLSDWSLENKLFSVTLNHPVSEIGIGGLRALLSIKNPLILNGQFLIGNCIARTLGSMARNILAAGRETIDRIRDSVKYVKALDSREEKFFEVKRQLRVPSEKILALDSRNQWNTTYEMLVAASDLKEVFSCLDTFDLDYKESPTSEDWKLVETLCVYLKLLFDTVSILTTENPTTNVFFHEVWKIQSELTHAECSQGAFVSALVKPIMEKFDKYWKDCSLLLALAVVMDPRFKMKLVEFSFSKIYGEDSSLNVQIVDEGIHELFLEYTMLPLPQTPACGNLNVDENDPGDVSANGLSDFDVYLMETSSQHMKSELDRYLDDSLLPRTLDFDVLGWWKVNRLKYPTLSHMARDILSAPVSTVPPESVFDTTDKEMDGYRCSLRSVTTEALICAKDWLRYGGSFE